METSPKILLNDVLFSSAPEILHILSEQRFLGYGLHGRWPLNLSGVAASWLA